MGLLQLLTILFIIYLLIVLVIFLCEDENQDQNKSENKNQPMSIQITGGGLKEKENDSEKRKTYVVDLLNLIHKNLDRKSDNFINTYPNYVQIIKAVRECAVKYKNVICIIKNQDGYELSAAERQFYSLLAKQNKVKILMAYDPISRATEDAHYLGSRDDKLIQEYNKPDYEIVSDDKFSDAKDFDKIPPFETIEF